jgi:hypothetical protein
VRMYAELWNRGSSKLSRVMSSIGHQRLEPKVQYGAAT